MALELEGARRAVERLLDDVVEVRRHVVSNAADVLDESTGQLLPPLDEGEVLWQGLGAVVPIGRPAMTLPRDGVMAVVPPTSGYRALLPIAAPPVVIDDWVRVVGSTRAEGPRDPHLLDRRFRVADPSVGSFAVLRVIRLELID